MDPHKCAVPNWTSDTHCAQRLACGHRPRRPRYAAPNNNVAKEKTHTKVMSPCLCPPFLFRAAASMIASGAVCLPRHIVCVALMGGVR